MFFFLSLLLKMTKRHSILCLTFKVELAVFLRYGAKNILISEYLIILRTCFYFWLQQIFDYFYWKKWHFGIIPLSFTILRKKIGSKRHLPHLSKLTNLFLKNILYLCSGFTLRFKEYFFSIDEYNMSILILFQTCSYDWILLFVH